MLVVALRTVTVVGLVLILSLMAGDTVLVFDPSGETHSARDNARGRYQAFDDLYATGSKGLFFLGENEKLC